MAQTNIVRAIEAFHAANPAIVLQANVSRHPYSFIGDRRGGSDSGLPGIAAGDDAPTQTWHDGLLGHVGFDIILDHFPRVFQLHSTPHALWAAFYLVPSLTSC